MTEAVLPPPLVPQEVDLRDFQYMELDVQKLRDSRFAAEVEAEAFRAGVLLWCASWHQVPAASLPNNEVELSALAGFGRVVKEWKKVRDQALELFVLCSDGRLYHRLVSEKANSAWRSRLEHFYERAKDRLRKANKARSLENPPQPPLPEHTFDQWNSNRLAGGVPMEKAEAFQGIPPKSSADGGRIPAEIDLKENGEGTERKGNGEGKGEGESLVGGAGGDQPAATAAAKTKGERGHRLSKEWFLPAPWGVWAIEKYPHWTPDLVREIAMKFRNHFVSKAGKDASKLDWYATWQNWCSSAITQREFPPPIAARTQPVHDVSARDAEIDRRMGVSTDGSEVIDA